MIVAYKKDIPAEAIKKRYCHICGKKLVKKPITKTVSPKDKEEWAKHERIGHTHVLPIGDIEVTEYQTFVCPKCGNEISIYKQAVIAIIQKKLGKNVLTDEEYTSNLNWANEKYEKKQRITKVVFFTFFALVCALVLYLMIKTGNFSFKLYL